MTKFNALFFFFISFTSNSVGQNYLKGKWYLFSRNRIIEFNFSKDSILTKQLNWDLSVRERNKPDTQMVIRAKEANGNIYLSLKKFRDTTNQILVNTFKITRQDSQLLMVLNGTDRPFKDTSLINQYINNDNDKKYGLILYSQGEIFRLRQHKKIAEMTVHDFKIYADNIFKFKIELDSLSKLQNAPNGLVYYGYSMIRNIIGQIGYNPMVTTEEYENFIKQFKNNPATKEIVAILLE